MNFEFFYPSSKEDFFQKQEAESLVLREKREINPALAEIKSNEKIQKVNTILTYKDDRIDAILKQKHREDLERKAREKKALERQLLEEQKKAEKQKNELLTAKQEDKDLIEIKGKGFYISKSKNSKLKEETQEKAILAEQKEENKNSKYAKAKLAIIIDDVGTLKNVEDIKATNLLLNPSFFPPTKNLKKTPELAKMFDFYMIHFPLEALNFNANEENTLKSSDSYENILKRVAFIRKNFPKATFINNHTGSKFTADEEAMKKLFRALDKYNFKFLDSKTIANTATQKIYKNYKQKFIYRDIFLDNIDKEEEVIKQIKSVVALAKKRGFAIAIGHPKKSTMKVLKEDHELFKEVELVLVKDIYEYY